MEENQQVLFQKSIVHLISEGAINEAIEEALSYFEKHKIPDYYEAVVLLSSRLQINQQEMMISGENQTSKNLKIGSQLLQLVNDFAAGKKWVSAKRKQQKKYAYWIALGAFLFIILWLGISNIYQTFGDQSPIIEGDDANIEFHNQPKKDTIQ